MAGEIYTTFAFLGGSGFAYGRGGLVNYMLRQRSFVVEYQQLDHGTRRQVTNEVTDWGSALGFDWARQNPKPSPPGIGQDCLPLVTSPSSSNQLLNIITLTPMP
jgi:hypothetical protein